MVKAGIKKTDFSEAAEVRLQRY